jgi:hypothetical protein
MPAGPGERVRGYSTEIDNPTKNSCFAPFSLHDNSRTTLGLRITKASLKSLKAAKTHTF